MWCMCWCGTVSYVGISKNTNREVIMIPILGYVVLVVVYGVGCYAIGYRQAKRGLPLVPPGGPKL